MTRALHLFETLSSTQSPAGAWLDCATQLEIAASDATFAGATRGQIQSLRDRADESRRNAIRASLRSAPDFVSADGSVRLSQGALS